MISNRLNEEFLQRMESRAKLSGSPDTLKLVNEVRRLGVMIKNLEESAAKREMKVRSLNDEIESLNAKIRKLNKIGFNTNDKIMSTIGELKSGYDSNIYSPINETIIKLFQLAGLIDI